MAETFDWMELFGRAQQLQINSGQRKGQAFYNAAYEQTERVRDIVNTERDPFHDDTKLDLFLSWLLFHFEITEGAEVDAKKDEDEGLHEL